MYNNLITIGNFTIHGYGLMIGIGIIAAWVVAEKRAGSLGLDTNRLWYMTICVLVFGWVSAKILYYITEIPAIIENPRILLDFANGFVVYGGIIGGLLSGLIYCRRHKISFLEYADLMLPSVALAQGFGRIGCFLAGCCYGVETSSPFHLVFHNSEFAPNGVPLVPTELISSGLNFLNFAVLLLIARRKPRHGTVVVCYLLFYSVGRFIIEFFRGDLIRGAVGPLSTSQFISIWVFAAALIILIGMNRKSRQKAAE